MSEERIFKTDYVCRRNQHRIHDLVESHAKSVIEICTYDENDSKHTHCGLCAECGYGQHLRILTPGTKHSTHLVKVCKLRLVRKEAVA
jgi:ribosomal protein L37E